MPSAITVPEQGEENPADPHNKTQKPWLLQVGQGKMLSRRVTALTALPQYSVYFQQDHLLPSMIKCHVAVMIDCCRVKPQPTTPLYP